jgi:hypothetical protein
MSDKSESKRRSGTRFIGVLPAGTIVTPELLASMVERAPRQDFDLDLTAEPVQPVKLIEQNKP